MRYGVGWNDVCILNLSSRGMMARSAMVPLPGSYVELRRGPHVIVARVVWAKDERFGVLAQDRIQVDALASSSGEGKPLADLPADRRKSRRSNKRLDDRHGASRLLSRAMEYAFFLIVGVSAAVGGFVTVEEAFANPLVLVSDALSGTQSTTPGPNP